VTAPPRSELPARPQAPRRRPVASELPHGHHHSVAFRADPATAAWRGRPLHLTAPNARPTEVEGALPPCTPIRAPRRSAGTSPIHRLSRTDALTGQFATCPASSVDTPELVGYRRKPVNWATVTRPRPFPTHSDGFSHQRSEGGLLPPGSVPVLQSHRRALVRTSPTLFGHVGRLGRLRSLEDGQKSVGVRHGRSAGASRIRAVRRDGSAAR